MPRLPSLTGLRFVAALLVFGFHVAEYAPDGPLGAVISAVFDHGLVGVSFFFVLSGFVLTWSRRTDDSAARFYRRRFARIAPAYWAALVLALAARTLNPPPSGPESLLVPALPSVVGVQAWFPAPEVHFGGNAVGWSVSAELFFYAAFPLLVPLLDGRRTRIALGAVALAVVVVPPVALHPVQVDDLAFWAVYIFPLQRIGEFVCGMLLATAMRAGRRVPIGPVGAMVLVTTCYLLSGLAPLWAQTSLLMLVPFLVLIAAVTQADADGSGTLAGRRVMRLLGEWSFSFYLVHQVVLSTTLWLVRQTVPPDAVFVVAVPVAGAASLLVAVCLYLGVEKPLEKRWRHARPRPEMSDTSS
ncbi:acyltransferase [Modestobacter sp. VKM Ac-2986]|uniref:acyltransferase family protein n=1 Tax=Modestobacter sp. VKM Ac-2986 TaxID=3004140 RepID=UPI0022AB8039|nr:acyltransferase [Modestobacter sp. VKM Ac-2986]MCZ2829852.1 acyltransferase [Modestobacter sp. VKM Ac-2986]